MSESEASSEAGSLSIAFSQAQRGERAQVDRLFEQCRPYLRLMAKSQLNAKLQSKVDSSDLVQQTMLDAYRQWENFRGQGPGELLAWLRQLLNHNAIDFARRYQQADKRQVTREVPLAEERGSTSPGAILADFYSTPSQKMMREEAEVLLAQAIANLPENYQTVIILRSLQRLPFEEVAEQMECSRGAAQMLWARAVKELSATYRGLEDKVVRKV